MDSSRSGFREYFLCEIQHRYLIGAEDKRDEEVVDQFVALVHDLHVDPANAETIGRHPVLLQPVPDSVQDYLCSFGLIAYYKRQHIPEVLLGELAVIIVI